MVGAAIGAGGGALTDAVSHHDKSDKHHLRRHLLEGALIGGTGADVVGDRARRYISNMPGIASYDSSKIKDVLTRHGLKGVWRGGVLDRPVKHTTIQSADPTDIENPDPSDPDGWSPALRMRREFMRRGMGVHTDEPAKDYFQTTGTIRSSDGRTLPHVQLNERFTDPDTGLLRQDPESKKVYNHLLADLRPSANLNYPGALKSDVLGSYSTDRPALDVVRTRDYFDYALEPRNKARLLPLTAELMRHPSHAGQLEKGVDLESEMRNYDGSTHRYSKGDYLKSLWSRELMDKVIGPNPAVFDSTFKYDTATGQPLQQFSNVTHDQGVSKDDSVMSKLLAAYNRLPSREQVESQLNDLGNSISGN